MLVEPEHVTFHVDLIDDPDAPARESIDPEELSGLIDSMGSNGLRQAIGLRRRANSDRAEILWGHRRTMAARALGWLTIEAKLYPASYDPAIARIEENLVRADLNPREEATAARALIKAGRTIEDVCRIMRRSRPWVDSRLRILDMPGILQDAVAAHDLGLAVADALAQVDHIDYLLDLVREAKRTGATRRTVDTWVAHYLADRERIIANHETVAQIISRREKYVVTIHCEVCDEPTPIEQSALVRACVNCLDQLDNAKRESAQAARQAPE